MTFKKINKMGQVIIEYFLLTAAVLAVVLFFSQSRFFARQNPGDPPGIKEICAAATNRAILAIDGVEEGNTIE